MLGQSEKAIEIAGAFSDLLDDNRQDIEEETGRSFAATRLLLTELAKLEAMMDCRVAKLEEMVEVLLLSASRETLSEVPSFYTSSSVICITHH